MTTPMILLHIPHSSIFIPVKYREQFVLKDEELRLENLRLTDSFTDEIFSVDHPSTAVLKFPASRLLVDPERFLSDQEEPMSARGMGALYTHCSDGTPLRRELSVQERADLIDSFYAPHHRKMGDIIKASLKDHGQCLILDCHSFPSSPLPCDADQSPRRPDICIGGDPFHTPTWVIRDLTWAFAERGLSVGINRPYWGTFIPRPWLGEESAVSSMMIELNRSLYMNEETGEKKKVFADFAALIREIVLDLITKSGREEA